MATFRKYGGTNFSPISNIVRHNILNSKSSSFNTSGLYNSKETYLSHIDMSGNSLLHVGNLSFQDGTSISSATLIDPPLSNVLSYGNSVGSYNIDMNEKAILDLSYVVFSDNTILNTATGLNPTLSSVLNFDNDADNLGMDNLGSINQTSGTNILKATEFDGLCKYIGGVSIVEDNDIPNKEYVDTLKFQLGQGLEFVDGTPKKLQVKLNLDFLTDVTLNSNAENTGHLVFNTTYGDSSVTDIYCQGRCLTFDNNSNTSDYTQKSFLFACNNLGDDNKETIPLQFNSSSFSVDLSNNTGGSSVRYEAINNSSYDISLGHNFTGNCYIDGSGGTFNPHLTIKQKSNSNNCIEYYTNLDSDTNYNGITKAGDNAIITYKPLSIAHEGLGITSGIRIDISNVRLQASNTIYYDLSLSTGHNFYGISTNIFGNTTSLNATTTNFNSTSNDFYNNITMKSNDKEKRQISTSYLNMYDINNDDNKLTQVYQSGQQLLFDNNSNTADNYYTDSFGFYCNNNGPDTEVFQTKPLSFNSSSFSVDLSNNAAGGSPVRYQAFNNIHYSSSGPIGHNFTGNCYFNNNILLNTLNSYIQFPNESKQYNAPFGQRTTKQINEESYTILTNEMNLYGIFTLGTSPLYLTSVNNMYQFMIINQSYSNLGVISNLNSNYLVYNNNISYQVSLTAMKSAIFTSFPIFENNNITQWRWAVTG